MSETSPPLASRGARWIGAATVAGLLLGARPATAQDPATAELLAAAKAARSDALYLWKDGRELGDWTLGEPGTIELMSAFKSVVALGIGRLLEEGKLTSLDQPVHTLFPEWNQGRKKAITIRHLMNHTSGLQNVPNAGAEIYPAPDAIQLALAAELDADPGAAFSYNNKAVNLLAGVIERASGLRMDLYLQERLFGPLEITRYQWYFDRSGKPHAMAGLQLLARDLAKFGRLVLDGGVWNGKRLLGERFLTELVAPSQRHYPLVGLLWWILPDSQSVTLRPEALRGPRPAPVAGRLAPLAGTRFHSRAEVRTAVTRILGPKADSSLAAEQGADWFAKLFDWRVGAPAVYYADGYLGQYLVIVPASRVVAVRQIRSRPDHDASGDGLSDFPALVARLAPRLGIP